MNLKCSATAIHTNQATPSNMFMYLFKNVIGLYLIGLCNICYVGVYSIEILYFILLSVQEMILYFLFRQGIVYIKSQFRVMLSLCLSQENCSIGRVGGHKNER